MKKKWVWAIVIFITIIAGVLTCEEPESPPPQEAAVEETEVDPISTPERTTVRLSLDPEIDGRTLVIRGRSDLPPGALLAYEVRHENWISDPSSSGFAEGTVRVGDGQYEERVDLSTWPAGSIEVWLAFQTILGPSAEQPADVLDQFGESGERLEGSNVSETGSLKRVELADTLRYEP